MVLLIPKGEVHLALPWSKVQVDTSLRFAVCFPAVKQVTSQARELFLHTQELCFSWLPPFPEWWAYLLAWLR